MFNLYLYDERYYYVKILLLNDITCLLYTSRQEYTEEMKGERKDVEIKRLFSEGEKS